MLGDYIWLQFIPEMFDGFEVRALCRPVKFFHTDLDKPFLYGPHLVYGGIVMLKQEKAFLKLLSQLEAQNVILCCNVKSSLHWN